MVEISNSEFLDFVGWRYTNEKSVPIAYGYEKTHTFSSTATHTVRVALVLDRKTDPTALLSMDWADRQKALSDLNAHNALWLTYGADAATYEAVRDGLGVLGLSTLPASSGYVSGAEPRTFWLDLTPTEFQSLFGTPLLWSGGTEHDPGVVFWNGNLSLPDPWGAAVKGLWVDYYTAPNTENLYGGGAILPPGAQSPGNDAAGGYQSYFPNQIADLYNYPLQQGDLPTGTIGLIEPYIGAAVPSGDFQSFLDAYRTRAGVPSDAAYYNVGTGHWSEERASERSLDVGVVAATNPDSRLGIYAGPGLPSQTTFATWQSAIWDLVNDPAVISSSWSDAMSTAPDSPFLWASRQLFVDAALRNLSMFSDAFDGGSSNTYGNGLTNVWQTSMSPYGVVVGGTSLSTPGLAASDPTLTFYMDALQAGDRGVLSTLVAGGLKQLPADAAALSAFIETVWNEYERSGNTLSPGYTGKNATSGGVDTTQGTPSYQHDFGLSPTSVGPIQEQGRGVPDVSALAGGNMRYTTPDQEMDQDFFAFGTSAATPFWASLGIQLNAIFTDQGLPRLGYMNDLLYRAAVVAPGAFNDVTIGDNISTFNNGGSFNSYEGTAVTQITPTGYGYSATPGYDLVSGLGSPNGLLLARALTAIAHAQMSSHAPDLLTPGSGGFTSPVHQSLLAQAVLAEETSISIHAGADGFSGSEAGTDAQAWSRQFAQQAMQSDFDPGLVVAFDRLSQVRPQEIEAHAGDTVSVSIGGVAGATPQASLSNAFGFVDFMNAGADSAVELARPVAVAATAGGHDDQTAIVRLRQSGESDSLSLTLYRVDGLDGTIGGVRPGDAGYAALVAGRAYELASGGTAIAGPGFGQFTENGLLHVDQGDIIAMALTNAQSGATPHTYYAFADANEQVDGTNVAHVWNYGLNTWGWEDLYGGGDLDYNDLVVQLDFTSASGHGVLI